jgi:uncharacterized protein YuzE
MVTIEQYLKFLPTIDQSPHKSVWLSYDAEGDVLYIQFKKPSLADESELTEDDILVRYQNEEIIGYTILHASKRLNS